VWRCEVKFVCGHRFQAFESHCRDSNGDHLRKIVYRLMKEDGTLVFQVDPHSLPIPYGDCPHLHVGPTQDSRLIDGSPELHGLSLRGLDFPKFWSWVQKYLYDGGKMPWDQ
jgi:hypothetical protein